MSPIYSMENTIELCDVHKVYKLGNVSVHALKGVTLKVRNGEFVSILGPSGSGKTTLLNLIGALDKPTKGEVVINGVSIKKLNDKQLADLRLNTIGFVFQAFYLIPWLNALENVQIPMMLAGKPPAYRKERALELLKLVGLEKRAYHKPNEMSGGEQQRVAIARALANKPQIILADEPTGNLDTKTGALIVDLLEKINKEEKVTVVVVTHNLEVAERTRRIIRLRDGEVVADEIKEVASVN